MWRRLSLIIFDLPSRHQLIIIRPESPNTTTTNKHLPTVVVLTVLTTGTGLLLPVGVCMIYYYATNKSELTK